MTSEAFISQVFEQIRHGFTPDDPNGSMTGAKVGVLLRAGAGPTYRDAGFPKLKDVLVELERRGWIRTGTNSKGAFAVWLSADASASQREATPITRGGPFRRLRQPVWHAFVSGPPSGERWMHRTTGEVRFGQTEAPAPAEEWVRLEQIDADAERRDAKEFLTREGVNLTEDIEHALSSPTWFVDLPRALEAGLAFRWKRHRTGRVAEHAEDWRRRNELPEHLVYGADAAQNSSSLRLRSAAPQSAPLRAQILESLGRLSIDELLALPIPARHLVAVLRPDLLS